MAESRDDAAAAECGQDGPHEKKRHDAGDAQRQGDQFIAQAPEQGHHEECPGQLVNHARNHPVGVPQVAPRPVLQSQEYQHTWGTAA